MAEQQPMDTALTLYDPAVLDAKYGAPGGENLPKLPMPSPIKANLRHRMSAASENLRIAPGVGMSLRLEQARWIDSEGVPHEWASVMADPNATGIVELRFALACIIHVVRSESETTEKSVEVATEQSEAISQLLETTQELETSLEATLGRVEVDG